MGPDGPNATPCARLRFHFHPTALWVSVPKHTTLGALQQLLLLFQRGESMSLEVYFKSPRGQQFSELYYFVSVL